MTNCRWMSLLFLAMVLVPITSRSLAAADEPLLTVAEKSDFKATSRHAEVVQFCTELARRSPLVRLTTMGKSFKGLPLPLMIIADPPVATPEEAAKSGKLMVYAQGNIHAGEVDGKEGLLMLARELVTVKNEQLLKDLVILIAPIFNADGNEQMAKGNRPGQIGPEDGMGIRPNAQGLDLNRDFIKLESPEVRALVNLMNVWKPALVMDLHTTNGSYHRYMMTYDGQRNPAGDADLVNLVRDELLIDAGRRLKKKSGYLSFTYGNFSRDRKAWNPYEATPRYGTQYVGLRNVLSVLVESYSHGPYKDRIIASRDFTRGCFEFVAANKDKVSKLLHAAEEKTVKAGEHPEPTDRVALRHKLTAAPGEVNVLGYEEVNRRPTEKLKEYPLTLMNRTEATLMVRRPYAYLFPPSFTKAVELLARHGIQLEKLAEEVALDLEVYKLDAVDEENFQRLVVLYAEATPRRETRKLPAGTILVKTGQPLGTLAAYLLEPQSEDGLLTWNFLGKAIAKGADFPVVRLPAPGTLRSEKVNTP